MREPHIVDSLPTWVRCFHKENKKKLFLKSTCKDIDYYKFVIYRYEKYQNDNSYIAGYFCWKGNKFLLDKALFTVSGIFFDDTYISAIEKYKELEQNGLFIQSDCLEEFIWTGNSPYETKI